MKKFDVGFAYTEYGTVTIGAETSEEAEEIAKDLLGNSGLKSLEPRPVRINDRDIYAECNANNEVKDLRQFAPKQQEARQFRPPLDKKIEIVEH